MLLHLEPSLYLDFGLKAKLISVEIPELKLKIEGDVLKTGKPYPNKNYIVGSLKSRKDIIGLIVDTTTPISKFTTIYTWDVELLGELKQTIINEILDQERTLVSQSTILHRGLSDKFDVRVHEDYLNMSPLDNSLYLKPIIMNEESTQIKPLNTLVKTDNKNFDFDIIVEQTNEIKLFTIEKERLPENIIYPNRYPSLDSAIKV